MAGKIIKLKKYLLSEAPQYLRDAFNASCPIPIESMGTSGMTLNGVRYRIYRDEAAQANTMPITFALDLFKMENPSEPPPDDPPAEERPEAFYVEEIVREYARRHLEPDVTWWRLLLSETEAETLEHMIEQRETYGRRPTAALMLDAAEAFADDGPVSDEQFDTMLEALRSKL